VSSPGFCVTAPALAVGFFRDIRVPSFCAQVERSQKSSINFAGFAQASSQLALSTLAPSVVKHYTGSKTAQDPFEYGCKPLINNNTAPVQKPRRTPFSEFFIDMESHSPSCHIEALILVKRRNGPRFEFVHHLHRKTVRNIREYRNPLLGLQRGSSSAPAAAANRRLPIASTDNPEHSNLNLGDACVAHCVSSLSF
jgi:hypothetical protein